MEITKKIYSEISAGELFDKISILEIKKNKIKDKNKRNIILKELSSLQETASENIEKSKSIIKLYNEEFKKDINYLMLDNEVFDWGPDPEELQNAIKMINHNNDLKETILNSIVGHFVISFSEFVGKKMTLDEINTSIENGNIE